MFLLFFLLVGMGLLWALWIVSPGLGSPPVGPASTAAPSVQRADATAPSPGPEPAHGEPHGGDSPERPPATRPDALTGSGVQRLEPVVEPAHPPAATPGSSTAGAGLPAPELEALARRFAAPWEISVAPGVDPALDVAALRRAFENLLAEAAREQADANARGR